MMSDTIIDAVIIFSRKILALEFCRIILYLSFLSMASADSGYESMMRIE